MSMNVALDFEFYEDGKTIEPISLGMAREDGAVFYREFEEFDWSRVPSDHWIWENVHKHLDHRPLPTSQIKTDILDFCGHSPRLWGWYCAYDFVVLMQLWGSFDGQRKMRERWNFPFFMHDLRTHTMSIPESKIQHHAMWDAVVIMDQVKKQGLL